MVFESVSLVYNPQSGKKKGQSLADIFALAWKAHFPEKPLTLFPSANAAHFAALALQEYKPKNRLILMGGDGSFSLGLTPLFEKNAAKKLKEPIGLLPAGSGNSFLRDFGITDFQSAQNALLAALKSGTSRNVDCGRFDFKQGSALRTSYFINIWAVGLICDINLLANKLRKSYAAATVLKIPFHKKYHYRVAIDGRERSLDADFIAVCNSQFTGGAMKMAPMASVDDKMLDAIIPSFKNRFSLLRLFPKLFSGAHVASKGVEHLTFQKMQIEIPQDTPVMVDGEMTTADSVSIQIVPHAWKLLV